MRTPFAILVASGLLTSLAYANPKGPAYFTEGSAARARVQKLPSMQGRYVDPCDEPSAIRPFWKPLPSATAQAARVALETYRNVLDCKAIKVYDVPLAHIEKDYEQAMAAGDTDAAMEIAIELRKAAIDVAIDQSFVTKRLKAVERWANDPKLPQAVRTKMTALVADARGELQAKRLLDANFVLAEAQMMAFNEGGVRLPPHRRCKFDPMSACLD